MIFPLHYESNSCELYFGLTKHMPYLDQLIRDRVLPGGVVHKIVVDMPKISPLTAILIPTYIKDRN